MSDSTIVDDAALYSYGDLYRMVASHESIVLYVPGASIKKIRQGVSNAKTRIKKKQAEEGFEGDDEKLDFEELVLSTEENKQYPKGTMKLRISLVENASVLVHRVEVSDKEL